MKKFITLLTICLCGCVVIAQSDKEQKQREQTHELFERFDNVGPSISQISNDMAKYGLWSVCKRNDLLWHNYVFVESFAKSKDGDYYAREFQNLSKLHYLLHKEAIQYQSQQFNPTPNGVLDNSYGTLKLYNERVLTKPYQNDKLPLVRNRIIDARVDHHPVLDIFQKGQFMQRSELADIKTSIENDNYTQKILNLATIIENEFFYDEETDLMQDIMLLTYVYHAASFGERQFVKRYGIDLNYIKEIIEIYKSEYGTPSNFMIATISRKSRPELNYMEGNQAMYNQLTKEINPLYANPLQSQIYTANLSSQEAKSPKDNLDKLFSFISYIENQLIRGIRPDLSDDSLLIDLYHTLSPEQLRAFENTNYTYEDLENLNATAFDPLQSIADVENLFEEAVESPEPEKEKMIVTRSFFDSIKDDIIINWFTSGMNTECLTFEEVDALTTELKINLDCLSDKNNTFLLGEYKNEDIAEQLFYFSLKAGNYFKNRPDLQADLILTATTDIHPFSGSEPYDGEFGTDLEFLNSASSYDSNYSLVRLRALFAKYSLEGKLQGESLPANASFALLPDVVNDMVLDYETDLPDGDRFIRLVLKLKQ